MNEADILAKKLLMLAENNHKRDGYLPVIDKFSGPAISQPWAAWRRYREINRLGTTLMDSRTRYTVPTEFPPTDIDGALASTMKTGLGSRVRRRGPAEGAME